MCFAVLRLRFVNVVHSLVFRSGLRYVIGVALLFSFVLARLTGRLSSVCYASCTLFNEFCLVC